MLVFVMSNAFFFSFFFFTGSITEIKLRKYKGSKFPQACHFAFLLRPLYVFFFFFFALKIHVCVIRRLNNPPVILSSK